MTDSHVGPKTDRSGACGRPQARCGVVASSRAHELATALRIAAALLDDTARDAGQFGGDAAAVRDAQAGADRALHALAQVLDAACGAACAGQPGARVSEGGWYAPDEPQN